MATFGSRSPGGIGAPPQDVFIRLVALECYWLLLIPFAARSVCMSHSSFPSGVTPESVMEQETIRAAMEMAKPTVCVVGAGGAGSNIVSWIKNKGIS